MKTWICKVCGYTHRGDEALESCPKCGASKSGFRLKRDKSGCGLAAIILTAISVFAIVVVFLLSCKSGTTVDNSTVNAVDIHRYQGRWYEIARLDHMFERGMDQCTATYELQQDGTIKVTNQGMEDGEWQVSEGRAKLTDVPGVLRVSFWRPFYSDYRILALAPDYSYALVGGSGDDYLWILSRTPKLNDKARDMLLDEAQRRGYATDKLIWVKQTERDNP